MRTSEPLIWRLCLLTTAVCIATGGPLHPRGTMAEMLADSHWAPAHLLMLAGFLSLGAALWLLARRFPAGGASRRWCRLAIAGTALQVIEMALHTAAMVDHDRLVAGLPTPVLSTHLALSVAFYPLFAASLIGFIVATSRERTLASPWVSWIGVLGVLGHGLAPVLLIGLRLPWARFLFPAILLFATWCALAAVWRPTGQSLAPSSGR